MKLPKTLLPALLALAIALAFPSFASADSLVYVKGGDVWISGGDGSRQTQLTKTGDYKYASQSEGGVIAASRGSRIERLSRTGAVERSYPTSVGDNDAYGPFDTEISPDGKTIAYEYWTNSDWWGLRVGVAYIDVQTGEHIGETQTGWAYPSWIDDSRLMHSGAPNALSEDVIVRGVLEPNNKGTQWFSHPEAGGVRDGDISRDGSVFAFVAGANDEFLAVYRRTGEVGVDAPEYCYHYLDGIGKFRDPAISPDGRSLAWQEDDGIHVGPLPDLSAGCSMPDSEGALTIPGGGTPDWGPADVPVPPKPRPNVGPAGKQKLWAALGKGLAVRVTGLPAGTRVTASVSKPTAKRLGLGRKALTVATGRTGATPVVRLKFAPKLVRKLRKARSLPLTVKAGAVRTTITLRR